MRFLDYKKVKDMEREKAKELFGTAAEPSALASKVILASNENALDIILIENRSWVSSPRLSTSPQPTELQQTRHRRTIGLNSLTRSVRRSRR